MRRFFAILALISTLSLTATALDPMTAPSGTDVAASSPAPIQVAHDWRVTGHPV